MLATLIGVLGDFDLAEDALQDAVAAAAERWPSTGIPENPAGWLVTVARNRAVDRLRRKYAFPILHGALEAIDLEAGAFDAVVMLDVIEHLRDPFGALARLHGALSPGGALVISTLDAESWVSRLLGKRLEDFRRTREHLFFFGRPTLSSILEKHGFQVDSIRSVGHTFNLAFLLERLALYNRPLFMFLRRVAIKSGLGSLQLSVNPHTKMIAFARRRG